MSDALSGLADRIMTRQELEGELSKIFDQRIEVERGQYEEDCQGDDYFTFSVDAEEIGGYFDIYFILMQNRPDCYYITEVNYYFE